MGINYINELINSKDNSLQRGGINNEALIKLKRLVNDQAYFEFLSTVTNGGLFFKSALQLYSCYALDFPNYIAYNADIAKQIVNLKDRQKVKLTIKNFPPSS
jgi:hypothetical protein